MYYYSEVSSGENSNECVGFFMVVLWWWGGLGLGFCNNVLLVWRFWAEFTMYDLRDKIMRESCGGWDSDNDELYRCSRIHDRCMFFCFLGTQNQLSPFLSGPTTTTTTNPF